LVGGAGGVRVKLGVQVGSGVGESSEGVVEIEGGSGCQVGEEVGIRVGVGVGVDDKVAVAMLFPSASESEKPPRSKPIEARAIRTPMNNCRKFFMVGFLQAVPLRPASGH